MMIDELDEYEFDILDNNNQHCTALTVRPRSSSNISDYPHFPAQLSSITSNNSTDDETSTVTTTTAETDTNDTTQQSYQCKRLRLETTMISSREIHEYHPRILIGLFNAYDFKNLESYVHKVFTSNMTFQRSQIYGKYPHEILGDYHQTMCTNSNQLYNYMANLLECFPDGVYEFQSLKMMEVCHVLDSFARIPMHLLDDPKALNEMIQRRADRDGITCVPGRIIVARCQFNGTSIQAAVQKKTQKLQQQSNTGLPVTAVPSSSTNSSSSSSQTKFEVTIIYAISPEGISRIESYTHINRQQPTFDPFNEIFPQPSSSI